MNDELWLPGDKMVEVEQKAKMRLPEIGKKEGGSYFDDELEEDLKHQQQFFEDMNSLVAHLNERPDHIVYVGGTEERDKLRQVFNFWKKNGKINHNPNIRIDYGVADGAIRVGDGR